MLFICEFWYLLKKTAFSCLIFKFCIVPAVDSRRTTQIPNNTQHSLASCLIVVAGVFRSNSSNLTWVPAIVGYYVVFSQLV